jgi:SAM-dependent methyltransferase
VQRDKAGPVARAGYHDNIRSDVFHLLSEKPGRILDVEGGTAATSVAIKAKFGADYVAVMDRAGTKPADGVDLFVQGNLDDPDLWDRLKTGEHGFDTILCLDVLEHLVNPWTIVKRCSALLNENGHLIVSLPNARNYRLPFALFFLGKFPLTEDCVLDRTHLRWFVRQSAISLVKCGGWNWKPTKAVVT